METRRFFCYSVPIGKRGNNKFDAKRVVRFHHLRDGNALLELSSLLGSRGVTYAGFLRNPMSGRAAITKPIEDGDLLVMATRPFLDGAWEGKRPLKETPTGWWLESQILARFRAFFVRCSRTEVALDTKVILKADPEQRAHSHWFFAPNGIWGELADHSHARKVKDRTIAFFAMTPLPLSLPSNNGETPRPIHCHCLLAFGMSGNATLLWSYLLRTRYWDAWHLSLDSPRFIAAQLSMSSPREDPADLGFADSWQAERLVDIDQVP